MTVRRWIVQTEVDAGARPGTTTDGQAETAPLKDKDRCLEEDNAILKASTVLFAGELVPCKRELPTSQPLIMGSSIP